MRNTIERSSRLNKLLEIASEPLSAVPPSIPAWSHAPTLLAELEHMLSRKDGFYAFESALHVLAAGTQVGSEPDLTEWNSRDGWRAVYEPTADTLLFFAQDVFACQFALDEGGVVRFNPESGEFTSVAPTLELWASQVLDEFPFETGWTLAREWQEEHGPLPRGHRLLPKRPFVLGGDYSAGNLVAVEMRSAVRMLGRLYSQIRDLPDGAEITLHGWLNREAH